MLRTNRVSSSEFEQLKKQAQEIAAAIGLK
uniref:Poly(U)-binding-splicing factor PUF60, peptide of, FIR, FBP, protein-protein complex n=1 Tax=Siphoviridae sp. ctZHD14 TaxID=2827891 RepID=A0A8S5SWB4_9CAUD|nr:MAG TPA: Poly(U)-binding-splicing factor PUF60, peptide of, FIR, FBP, protein-protein complex [Siphoviridae sp. ctZHD14]